MEKTLSAKAKKDNEIMRIMKVSELSHIVAKTNKGELVLRLPKGGTAQDYRFVLDAVPFDDKTNKALLEVFKGTLFNIFNEKTN